MGTPYLSEIRIFAFPFAPKGWAMCNGQLMSIQQNAALFSLLGTTYGGDGVNTFALPNVQGRIPVHNGTAPGGTNYSLGETGGEVAHTLTGSELPSHVHTANANSSAAAQPSPASNVWAVESRNAYSNNPSAAMVAGAIANTGGGQPHNNMAPYLVVSFCVALTGIFPTRN